jgi:hypothetical protein
LRLFVSREYTDWTEVEQYSPFWCIRGNKASKREVAVGGWGAKTIPVIITKSDEESDDSDVVEED